jgi:predicted phosphodiesterase
MSYKSELLNVVVEGNYFDIVVYGHSHNHSIERKRKTLAVNLRELCWYLTGKSTVVILDI